MPIRTSVAGFFVVTLSAASAALSASPAGVAKYACDPAASKVGIGYGESGLAAVATFDENQILTVKARLPVRGSKPIIAPTTQPPPVSTGSPAPASGTAGGKFSFPGRRDRNVLLDVTYDRSGKAMKVSVTIAGKTDFFSAPIQDTRTRLYLQRLTQIKGEIDSSVDCCRKLKAGPGVGCYAYHLGAMDDP